MTHDARGTREQPRASATEGTRPRGRGGARRGAGRPRAERPSVPHARRPSHSPEHPVHVTLRMARHTWSLRSERCYHLARQAFERANRRGLVSIAHYSVQGNHIHLIVESRDRRALAAGVKRLEVRLARALNRLMGKRGRAFGDRYHTHELDSASAVQNALGYVLLNRARHFPEWAGLHDPYSSAGVFDTFAAPLRATWSTGAGPPAIEVPATRLLRNGLRALRMVDPSTVPGRRRRPL